MSDIAAAVSRAIAGEPAPVTAATIPAYWGEGATAASIIAWFVADRERVIAEGGVVDEGFYERAIAKYAGMGGA